MFEKIEKIRNEVNNIIDLKVLKEESPFFYENLESRINTNTKIEDLSLMIKGYHLLKLKNNEAAKKYLVLIRTKKESCKNRILTLDLLNPKVSNINDFIVNKKEYGEIIKAYDYCLLTDEIKKQYEINFDNIYSNIRNESLYNIMINELLYTEKEVKDAMSISPLDSECALLISALGNCIGRNEIPYVNSWHHLYSRDFSRVKKDSIVYMNNEDNYESLLFQKIRKIYFLETNSLKFKKIPFYINW